jgi:DNA adenine methylase
MQTTIAPPLKSPLRWLGNKSRLPVEQKEFIRSVSQDRRWVAPYCGGLGLELEIQPKEAFLLDENYDLINFWFWVSELMEITPRDEFTKEGYLALRDLFNSRDITQRKASIESARDFYTLNKTCLNGLVRYSHTKKPNLGHKFNAPCGDRPDKVIQSEFSECQKVIQGWRFEVGGFKRRILRPGDFLFLDPPYVSAEGKTNAFTGYWPEPFGWGQQEELLEWAAVQACPIVACNAWNLRLVEMYRAKGFEVQEIQVPRSVSADGGLRGKVSEMFATKNI